MKTSLTPLRLTRLSAAGSILMVVACLLSFLPSPDLTAPFTLGALLLHGHWERLFAVPVFATGLIMAYSCQHRLSKGLRHQVWPEEQIDAARTWIGTPTKRWVLITSAFVVVVIGSIHILTGHQVGGIIFFISALNPVSSLLQTLRKPLRTGAQVDWAAAAPVHSDHWGQPPASA